MLLLIALECRLSGRIICPTFHSLPLFLSTPVGRMEKSSFSNEQILPAIFLFFGKVHQHLKHAENIERAWSSWKFSDCKHIAFLTIIKDSRVLTKNVTIDQSEGIPVSSIPQQAFVKNVHKHYFPCSPSRPYPSPRHLFHSSIYALCPTIQMHGTG